MGKKILMWSVGLLAGLYFLFTGLSQAKAFLVPLSFGVLLAVLLYPFALRLEKWGLSRGLSSFISVLSILAAMVGISLLVSVQITGFIENWQQMEQHFRSYLWQMQQYINEITGMPPYKQEQEVKEKLPGFLSNIAGNVVMRTFTVFASLTLSLVYTFFFLLSRARFRKFIIKLVSKNHESRAEKIIGEAGIIAGSYLFGKLLLISSLIIFYATGFLIIGVPQAILVAIVAAIFSIIPYVGNIIGGSIALIMTLMTGGGLGAGIGVIAVFSTAQFIESYILEPWILGSKVDLNPVFIIMSVVLGGIVWDIPGMILAIPYLGILKVILDNIDELEPFGYLMGGKPSSRGKLKQKITGWVS